MSHLTANGKNVEVTGDKVCYSLNYGALQRIDSRTIQPFNSLVPPQEQSRTTNGSHEQPFKWLVPPQEQSRTMDRAEPAPGPVTPQRRRGSWLVPPQEEMRLCDSGKQRTLGLAFNSSDFELTHGKALAQRGLEYLREQAKRFPLDLT